MLVLAMEFSKIFDQPPDRATGDDERPTRRGRHHLYFGTRSDAPCKRNRG